MSRKDELPKRTKKDEDQYNEELRRESPIKTEVIVELRELNKTLLANQVTLLKSLIDISEAQAESLRALNVYRRQLLQQSKDAVMSDTHCVPGCNRHRWDNVDGWHSVAESQLFLAR